MSDDKITIQIAGENSLMIYFAEEASESVSAKVQRVKELIYQYMHDEVIDLVSSYASIMVMFNIEKYDHHNIRCKLRNILNKLSHEDIEAGKLTANLVELPVYYSIESGPDLKLIAQRTNLSVEDIINIHQSQEYLVYAIGFAPGFAYLGEVDKRISSPRLSSPRLKVPKGAVAIADRQTAIYPSVSPGGWNLIGLCPIDMFDVKAKLTMPVQVGDKVKFNRISKSEFLSLGGELPVGEVL